MDKLLRLVLLLGSVLAAGASAHAEGLCSEAFNTWLKSIQGTMETQPKPDASGRKACLPTEAARKSLQRSLARVRRRCESSDAGPEAEATKPLIEINADVLATTPICSGGAKLAAGPSSSDAGSCVSLNHAGKVYYLANTRCTGSKVIAVVEIKLSSGAIKCRGHIVTDQTKLGTAKPNVNYECIENGSDCSTASVKGIFPFCSW